VVTARNVHYCVTDEPTDDVGFDVEPDLLYVKIYIHDTYARLGGYVSAASGGRKEITDWHN
jgi:hypothetical protein